MWSEKRQAPRFRVRLPAGYWNDGFSAAGLADGLCYAEGKVTRVQEHELGEGFGPPGDKNSPTIPKTGERWGRRF